MIRTLIVEDDFRVAKVHVGFTERVSGFEVVGTAHTAAAALAAVSEGDRPAAARHLPPRRQRA